MNTKWLIKNWFRVGHKISWKLSFETLIGLLYFNPNFQKDWVYNIIQKKHRFVLDYLRQNFQTIIDKYKSQTISTDIRISEKRYIWVMWWQGEQNAPDLVKMCIDSIRKNANRAEVVVITEQNYRNYVQLPDYIIKKHKEGYISFAQLSDIMRIFLISEHGGLWLDATIFVSQRIPEEIFGKAFYSLHTELRKTPFVQNDRVHCFVMGGRPDSKLICFVKDLLSAYWKDKDVIIDYYLLDYSIMLAYYEFPDIHDFIDNLDFTSDGLYQLVSLLDEPYDGKAIDDVLESNTFSKLVWNVKHSIEKDCKETVYGHLLNKYKIDG